MNMHFKAARTHFGSICNISVYANTAGASHWVTLVVRSS
jgi:hypothetical protein